MLVLGRRINDALILTLPDGQEIRVVVCDVRRQDGKPLPSATVRVGIEAAREIKVRRGEHPAKELAK